MCFTWPPTRCTFAGPRRFFRGHQRRLTRGGVPGNVPFGTLTSLAEHPTKFECLRWERRRVGACLARCWTLMETVALPLSTRLGKGKEARHLWVSEVAWSRHDPELLVVALNGYRHDCLDAFCSPPATKERRGAIGANSCPTSRSMPWWKARTARVGGSWAPMAERMSQRMVEHRLPRCTATCPTCRSTISSSKNAPTNLSSGPMGVASTSWTSTPSSMAKAR